MVQFALIIPLILVLFVRITVLAERRKFVVSDSILAKYIAAFNSIDSELYPEYIRNEQAYDFLQSNIPLLDFPDKVIISLCILSSSFLIALIFPLVDSGH